MMKKFVVSGFPSVLAGAAALLAPGSLPVHAQTLEMVRTFNYTTDPGSGAIPTGNPCVDEVGNLYGTCQIGGLTGGSLGLGGGTLWRLAPGGSLSVLTSFSLGGNDGGLSPRGGPVFGGDGSLYGANSYVGTSNSSGAVYRVTLSGVRTGVVDFPIRQTGFLNAASPVVRGPGGEVYGTTLMGGTAQAGSVWQVDAAGNFSTLVNLTRTAGSPTQGETPAGLTVAGDGSVYFMARAADPPAFNDYIILYQWKAGVLTAARPFNAATQGDEPVTMTASPDGNLYGIIRRGSIQRFFQRTPAGTVTILQTLPATGGGGEQGNECLHQGQDGKFYTRTASYPSQPAVITREGGYTLLPLPPQTDTCTGLAPGRPGYFYGAVSDNNINDAHLGGGIFRFSISLPVDGDGDGLPDAWEVTHFGNAGNVRGTDDTDGDGMNNFGEYAFGLNPQTGDLTNLPQPVMSGGLMTFSITKQPFATYVVQTSTGLTGGSWTTSGLTILTDDETLLAVRETTAAPRRFFRVVVNPAP